MGQEPNNCIANSNFHINEELTSSTNLTGTFSMMVSDMGCQLVIIGPVVL
jgi:hypothetical protein